MKSYFFTKTFSILIPSMTLISLLSSGCAASTLRLPDRSASSAPGRIITFESNASGFNTKTFFYDNGEEVVAVDMQFTEELAEKAIQFLKSQTSSKLTYAIITHPNPDKFNGLRVFQRHGAKVIASSETATNLPAVDAYKKYYFVQVAKMFTAESYPTLGQPDILFDREYKLRLNNGDVIAIKKLSQSGVSTDQTVVFISKVNALFVGDLVHHKAHAWLEGGIINGKPAPSLKNWQHSLEEVQRLYKSTNPVVYGGRGHPAALEIALAEQAYYLNTADKLISDFLASAPLVRRELKSDKAATHYQTLLKLFEAKFPENSLSFMIQYGVYGLVESKL